MTTQRFKLHVEGWPQASLPFPEGEPWAGTDSFECELQLLTPTIGAHPKAAPCTSRPRLPHLLVLRTLAAGLMTLASLSFGQSGHPFELSWSAIAGSGGQSSGGPFSISGTLGQAGAGVLDGGNYSCLSGFWAITRAIQEPGAPLLRITRGGQEMILSWPDPSTGFELQETSALVGSPLPWTSVGQAPTVVNGEKQVRLPAAGEHRFFRLRKP
jgi:hypothetical protein